MFFRRKKIDTHSLWNEAVFISAFASIQELLFRKIRKWKYIIYKFDFN